MIQVKIIKDLNCIKLTKEVNDWLEKHDKEIRSPEIKHRVTGRMDTTTVVMIKYYSDTVIKD